MALAGEVGTILNLDYSEAVSHEPAWLPLATVTLANSLQFHFDATGLVPPQRFYRAWQPAPVNVVPSLDLLRIVPELTLTGAIGDKVRVDAINQFGPIDAWFTLDTVTLTNTTQLYFDTTARPTAATLSARAGAMRHGSLHRSGSDFYFIPIQKRASEYLPPKTPGNPASCWRTRLLLSFDVIARIAVS